MELHTFGGRGHGGGGAGATARKQSWRIFPATAIARATPARHLRRKVRKAFHQKARYELPHKLPVVLCGVPERRQDDAHLN